METVGTSGEKLEVRERARSLGAKAVAVLRVESLEDASGLRDQVRSILPSARSAISFSVPS